MKAQNRTEVYYYGTHIGAMEDGHIVQRNDDGDVVTIDGAEVCKLDTDQYSGIKDNVTVIVGGRTLGKTAIVGHSSLLGMEIVREIVTQKQIPIISIEDAASMYNLREADAQLKEFKFSENYTDNVFKLTALPKFSVYGEEKKKTKPCTSHEYVSNSRKEGSAIFITWKCRHCNHPLK